MTTRLGKQQINCPLKPNLKYYGANLVVVSHTSAGEHFDPFRVVKKGSKVLTTKS